MALVSRRRASALLAAFCLAAAWLVLSSHQVPAATGAIVEYPVLAAASNPTGITAGPDGNMWFTEFSAGRVGVITPSGVVTEYPIPTPSSNPEGIAVGPDQKLWITEYGADKIAKLSTSLSWTEYQLPANSRPFAITAGPDGNVWFTEANANKIGRITTAGVVSTWNVPSGNAQPEGITTGPDGNLWFSELAGDALGQITTGGAITEYVLPSGSSPYDITAGPDGNLWFTEYYGNKVGRLTLAGVRTEFAIPTPSSYPVGIAAGPDGTVWFTESGGGKVARVTTGGVITEFIPPHVSSAPVHITAGPDHNMWFTESNGNNIARLQVDPAITLPAVANAAYGGYTTAMEIQNVGPAPANVFVYYTDSSGQPVGSGDSILNLPVNATWTVRQDNGHSFAAGAAGSARVYSSSQVIGFVNEFAPGGGDATSYTGIQSGGPQTRLFLPTITNKAYGGYTTGIGLINSGTVPTDITVSYRNAAGAVQNTATMPGVAPGAYVGLYSGDPILGLPSGFAGTATIDSKATPIAAIVNETGPGGQFSSYDGIAVPGPSSFAPVALNNAYGGYNTGFAIQNVTGNAATVTITYYDLAGHPTATTSPIAAYGYLGVYQGTDIPIAGAYTAVVTVNNSASLAMVVNEVAPAAGAARQSTSYNAFPAGATALALPLVENTGADGWSTGEGIVNTGPAPTTVTITYFDVNTGVQVGTPDIQSLPAHAYWGLYQPNGGLPAGARASAVVTVAAGGTVAAICNEQNATTFMSYDGQ